jgi:hypothetical protein
MLMNDAPPSCVLRIGKDSERFDAYSTLSFSDLSGGHQGGMFTYTGNGQGLAAVFDESKTSFNERAIRSTMREAPCGASGTWTSRSARERQFPESRSAPARTRRPCSMGERS